MNRPLKVMPRDRSIIHVIVASSLSMLKEKAGALFNIASASAKIVLECDGTYIISEEYFQTLDSDTKIIILNENETWAAAGSLDGIKDLPRLKKVELDSGDAPWTTLHLTEVVSSQFDEAAKKYCENPKIMAGAQWAAKYILPHFAALEKEYVETVDKLSLIVLRFRINSLEMLFMVDNTTIPQLLTELELDQNDVVRITTEIKRKIDAINMNSPCLQQLSTMMHQELLEGAQSTHAAENQTIGDPVSQWILRKASVHYFRWKYAFKQQPHSTVGKIRDFLKTNNVEEEDFFIEVATLRAVTSMMGIPLPTLPNVGIDSVKRSLKLYSLNHPTTVLVVESLFCTIPPS